MLKILPLLLLSLLTTPLMAQTTHTAHTPDADIAYFTLGAQHNKHALPIIAINGGPGLSHVYMVQNDLWKRVARHRLVVLYDQRGTGASKPLKPGASLSMDAQVADLEAVRAALNLDKVALLGDSFGGFLAMAYMAQHPEHVARLILSDSPPASLASMVHLLPQVFPDVEEQAAAEADKLRATPDAAAQAGLISHFRMIFYSPEKRDAYLAHAGSLGYEPAIAHAVSEQAAHLDLTREVAKIQCPTLVLTGRYDMNVAPLNAWNLQHQIPNARLVIFEKSGHLPSYEEPARYLSVLETFLNQP